MEPSRFKELLEIKWGNLERLDW